MIKMGWRWWWWNDEERLKSNIKYFYQFLFPKAVGSLKIYLQINNQTKNKMSTIIPSPYSRSAKYINEPSLTVCFKSIKWPKNSPNLTSYSSFTAYNNVSWATTNNFENLCFKYTWKAQDLGKLLSEIRKRRCGMLYNFILTAPLCYRKLRTDRIKRILEFFVSFFVLIEQWAIPATRWVRITS